MRAAFAATREIFGAYEIDFRILHGAEVRWVSARGRGDDQGIVGRIMFGVFLDVTERKLAEEAREMLANEMAHRVKNLFAIAAALTGFRRGSTATTAEMARDLTERLARARAVRTTSSVPFSASRRGPPPLATCSPFFWDPTTTRERSATAVQVSVPDLLVGEGSATTLALVVHELATNSIKYGSLSKETGTVAVSCTAHDSEVVIVWTETGGPPIRASNKPSGFGSQLVTEAFPASRRHHRVPTGHPKGLCYAAYEQGPSGSPELDFAHSIIGRVVGFQ